MPKTNKTNSKQQLKLNWALLCRSASVDQQSNQISLFGVVDEMTLTKNTELETAIRDGKKVQIRTDFSLVAQFERNDSSERSPYSVFMKVRILDPLGTEIGKVDMTFEMQQDKRRTRVVINFINLVVTQKGDYSFEVSLRYPNESSFSEITRVPLEVKII